MCLPQALVCPAEATPICSSTCHPRPQLLALPVGDAANPEGQQAPLGTARWVLGDLVSHTAWGDWPEPDHRPGVTLSGCSQPPGAGDGSCAQSGGKGRVRTVAGWTAGRPGASPQDPPRRPRGPQLCRTPPGQVGTRPPRPVARCPREGRSPHGAQAAAVHLQLAEAGQVCPCGPQGAGSEATPRRLQRHRRPRPPLPVAALRPSGTAPVCGRFRRSTRGRAQKEHLSQRSHSGGHQAPGAGCRSLGPTPAASPGPPGTPHHHLRWLVALEPPGHRNPSAGAPA